MSQAVRVMVRCRPMNQKEKERGCKNVVEVDQKNRQINLLKQDSKQQPKSFTFDYVFGIDSSQSLIYQQSAFTLVDSVLQGYNGTIFAYGQTGCGKTHTMMGTSQSEESRGITPRTFNQIMTLTKSETDKTHLIRCSFIEIYNEEIHDLLGKDIKARMELKQSVDKGVFVKDLTQLEVQNTLKMEHYMQIGFKNRATRATNMNAQSSRSHSIFTIYIDSQEVDEKGNDKYKASKLNLVDLAGSQRISKTGTTGDGMKQATKINLSLSALGNVISALVDGKMHHIPYRDSKLTRLLQDSLGGNTKTLMIAAVSPANYNYDQSLSTLRYANRAKNIQNKPMINQDPKDALLREYMDEIKKLKMMLQGKIPLNMAMEMIGGGDASMAAMQERVVYRDVVGDGNKQNNVMMEQLRNKENMLRMEQEQKKMLQQKLQSLQGVFHKGADSQANNKELQKIKKLKEKLKCQKKKQQQYQKQKTKRQSELLSIEKNYKSLNEEVDQMRERFQEIKKKYISNLSQLRDIQNEHEDEKEQLLDTIRYQEKEIKKFTAILNILMNQDQLDLIVNNSEWNEQKREWFVPSFTYKERFIQLPKLGRADQRNIQNQKQKRQINFRESSFRDSKRQSDTVGHNGFKMNKIVRNARQSSECDIPSIPSEHSMRSNSWANKAQLTPLKNDSSKRIKMGIPANKDQERNKKKLDRLDPIQFLSKDSPDKKYFQQY